MELSLGDDALSNPADGAEKLRFPNPGGIMSACCRRSLRTTKQQRRRTGRRSRRQARLC